MSKIYIIHFLLLSCVGYCQSKINKSLVPEMVSVEGGTFIMGISEEEEGTHIYNGQIGYEYIDGNKPNCCREKPAHKVILSSFEISKTETTVRQWRYFCIETNRDLPSYFSLSNLGYNRNPSGTNDYPVQVNWNDAVEYCNWLSKKTGEKYRLPTEAEWEFAARGGNKSKKYRYAGGNDLDIVGNKKDFSFVATKKPNELGLYDMSGNVWEWCYDNYYLYSEETVKNPKGPGNFTGGRVIRGGGHVKMYTSRPHGLDEFKVSAREYSRANYDVIGFRVVKEVNITNNNDSNLIKQDEPIEIKNTNNTQEKISSKNNLNSSQNSNSPKLNEYGRTVLFSFGSAELDNNTKDILNSIIQIMNYYKTSEFEILGYSITRECENCDLAKERANNVKKYLTDKGISPDRLFVKNSTIEESSKENYKKDDLKVEIILKH